MITRWLGGVTVRASELRSGGRKAVVGGPAGPAMARPIFLPRHFFYYFLLLEARFLA